MIHDIAHCIGVILIVGTAYGVFFTLYWLWGSIADLHGRMDLVEKKIERIEKPSDEHPS